MKYKTLKITALLSAIYISVLIHLSAINVIETTATIQFETRLILSFVGSLCFLAMPVAWICGAFEDEVKE